MSIAYAAKYGRKFFPKNYFTDLCTIYAPPDSTGSNMGDEPDDDYPGDWSVFASAVPCQVIETRMSGREGEVANQTQSSKPYDINVPASTSRPLPKYRIRVTTQNRDFEITHPVQTSDPTLMKIESIEIFNRV